MICLAHPFTSDVLPIEYCCCWLLKETFPPAMFQVAGFIVGGTKHSGGVCCTPFVMCHPLLSHTLIGPPFVLWHLQWPPFEVYYSHPPLFISCCRAVAPQSISFARCWWLLSSQLGWTLVWRIDSSSQDRSHVFEGSCQGGEFLLARGVSGLTVDVCLG